MIHYPIVHTVYDGVLHQTGLSIRDEQMFCSITTQMTYLPAFKSQSSLEIVHRENYQTSYHRNTAAGNLRRLCRGEFDELLVLMTVECLIEARKHDKAAKAALDNITVTNPHDEKWIHMANKWHRRRKQHLTNAAMSLRGVIGETTWKKGAALAD